MNEAKTKSSGIVSDIIIAITFSVVGGLWLSAALFFITDAIEDYREAHSPEVGLAAPWTWHHTLQYVGVGGLFFGFAPPAILLGYGLYLSGSTLGRAIHRLTPNTQ